MRLFSLTGHAQEPGTVFTTLHMGCVVQGVLAGHPTFAMCSGFDSYLNEFHDHYFPKPRPDPDFGPFLNIRLCKPAVLRA